MIVLSFEKLVQGGIGFAACVEKMPQSVVGLSIIWLETQGFLKLRQRLVTPAMIGENASETAMGFGEFRSKMDDILEFVNGFVDSPLAGEKIGEVIAAFDVVGPKLCAGLELLDGVVDPVLAAVVNSEVGPRNEIIIGYLQVVQKQGLAVLPVGELLSRDDRKKSDNGQTRGR